MASTITNTLINEAILSNSAKALLTSLNSGTASTLSIQASQLSHPEQAICRDLLAGTATRVGINNRNVDLAFKSVALAIANV